VSSIHSSRIRSSLEPPTMSRPRPAATEDVCSRSSSGASTGRSFSS
jgi:hypothetical protein